MRLSNIGTFYAVFIGLFVFQTVAANAETATDWVVTDQTRLRLVSEIDGVKGRDSLRLGLQIKLAPGWKTYWRSPGDAGIPPRFDWSGSQNVENVRVFWPLPEKFDAYGLSSWGYHNEVVFPIELTLSEPGKPLDLKLRLQLGICEEVCVPYEHEFSLYLGAEGADRSTNADDIDRFVRRVPSPLGSKGTALNNAIAVSKDDQEFTVTVSADQPFKDPEIIVEGKVGAYFDLISTEISKHQREVVFTLAGHLPAKSDRMPGQNITVTVFDEGLAGEAELQVD